MLKKLLIVTMTLVFTLHISNGYYQATEITFEGIEETCYGTLLSRYSESGSWAWNKVLDLKAPEEVKQFFREYEDENRFFYLNYFQDVTDGLLYWPTYPPEIFKVLLYFPDSDTYIVSEQPISRYALTSTYKATVSNGQIEMKTNYNYFKLSFMTLLRTALETIVMVMVALFFGRPDKKDRKVVIIACLIYHVILNILISVYSFKNGFSRVEYFVIMWLPYILMFLLQGFIYTKKAYTMKSPYYSGFFSSLAGYIIGLILVDWFPKLFTIT